jgi:hypothetical protein
MSAPKRRGRGKSIGNAFEREICYILSMWWSEGQDDDIFWRTDTSGGRATVRHRKGKKAQDFADIKAVKRCGEPLTNQTLIECKTGYRSGINPLDYFEHRFTNLMKQFWEKAEAEADKGMKKWTWLIFRRKNKQIQIMMNFNFLSLIAQYHGLYKYNYLTVNVANKIGLTTFFITNLKDFLEYVSPHTIVGLESRPTLCKR